MSLRLICPEYSPGSTVAVISTTNGSLTGNTPISPYLGSVDSFNPEFAAVMHNIEKNNFSVS
jgi:hypothetical protein